MDKGINLNLDLPSIVSCHDSCILEALRIETVLFHPDIFPAESQLYMDMGNVVFFIIAASTSKHNLGVFRGG